MTSLTWTDNCDAGGSVEGVDGVLIGGACGGTITRTWNVSDACGNPAATRTQVITVDDNIAPALIEGAVIPQGITGLYGCATSAVPAGPTEAEIAALFEDNCSNVIVTKTVIQGQGELQIESECEWSVTYNYTIQDNCGNFAEEINVTYSGADRTPPVLIGIPANTTANCGAIPAAPAVTATDNCDQDASLTVNFSEINDEIDGCGIITRTWTVSDACGNSTSETQIITVIDNQEPVLFGVPANITVTCDEIPEAPLVTATDNCDATLTVVFSENNQVTGGQGTIVRTWSVYDNCGNQAYEDQTITVVDNEAPVINCPANVTVFVDENTCEATQVELGEAVASDNCGTELLISNDAPVVFPTGTTTVTWTATDNAGNSISCEQTITVVSALIANDDYAEVQEDTPTSIKPLANDTDCNNNIDPSTLEILTQPIHGTISAIDSTGAFIYTPEQGFFGKDTMQYKVCDLDEQCDNAWIFISIGSENDPPVAVNDTFNVGDCNPSTLNVLLNDSDGDGDGLTTPVIITNVSSGSLTLNNDGTFEYTPVRGFEGVVTFTYEICDNVDASVRLCDQAQVTINVLVDTDCDDVPDEYDLDSDNDGILDVDETLTADSDGDGIPNYLDIDSDNDGILDNIEAQAEGTYRAPLFSDVNNNGWDDAYDPDASGTYFSLADTDTDGTPDFIDTDTDDDSYDDYIEGFDVTGPEGKPDGVADIIAAEADKDGDGLDDAYDTVNGWQIFNNPIGGNAPLPDYNNDGIRDWRDAINNPERPDTTLAVGCEPFVPNGFSPDGDNINDYFKVKMNCTEGEAVFGEEYPDAKIMIFNRWGNLLFEKENYGNIQVWGELEAWWDGTSGHNWTVGKNKVPVGTYAYVLLLNDNAGTVYKGTVFVNYND